MTLLLTLLLAALAQADGTCRIKNQSGSLEGYWCSKYNKPGVYRCYADVEFRGRARRIWSSDCVESISDCWWSGSSPVVPGCAE